MLVILVSYLSITPGIFVRDSRLGATRLTRAMLLSLAGADGDRFDPQRVTVVGDNLLISGGFDVDSGIELVPLKNIVDARVENWGLSFFSRDIKKLFRIDGPPRFMVVRLFLNTESDKEREVSLFTENAERWKEELLEAVSKVSLESEIQVSSSEKT